MKRIIPTLLLENGELWKTKKFREPNYIGDPLVATRIFNELRASEISICNISPDRHQKPLPFQIIADIAGECFSPISYTGGVSHLNQIEKLIYTGIDKVGLNTALFTQKDLLAKAAKEFGSSTIIASIDYSSVSQKVWDPNIQKYTLPLDDFISQVQDAGAGEIMLQCRDKEGTLAGPDFETIRSILPNVAVPILYGGGIKSGSEMLELLNMGIDGLLIGAHFVYVGRHNAVLIHYLSEAEKSILNNEIV